MPATATADLNSPSHSLLQDRRWVFLRSGWFATIFFLLATAAFTWPLVTHMANTVPDALDSTDTARQLGEIARNLLTNPLHIYDSRGLYPLNNDLALNELLIAQGIYAAPIVWLTGNVLLAWNLVTFSSFFLSGLGTWFLVRRATGSSLAGMAAGITYAFSPWHYGEYGHLGIVAIQWMVFALYFLVRFMDHSTATPRLLDRRSVLFLGLFGFFTALQALSAGYYGYYEAILFSIYLLYYALRNAGIAGWLRDKLRRTKTTTVDWRRLGGQVVALGVTGAVVLAVMYQFLLPYTQAKNAFGFNRSLSEVEYWSAGPRSFLRTTVTSWLYEPVQRGIFGLETSAEREMYPGTAAVLLAMVGLFATRNRRKMGLGPGLFGMVILVGLVLSFGPTLNLDSYGIGSTGIPLPYRWLYEHVPGFDALRVPHRFDLFVMLGLGACAGFGIVRLMEWSRGRRILTPGLAGGVSLALVMADFFAPGLRYIERGMGENAPPLYRWLAGSEASRTIPKDALLLELPIGVDKTPVNSSPQYLLYALEHGRPMLNGSPNIIPAGYERLFSEMRRFPTQATLDIAEGLGVKFIIVHTGGLLNDDKRAALGKEAWPGGRLEMVQTLPDTNPDGTPNPTSEAVVYRLQPSPARLATLKAAIPAGASVLLADHPSKLRLSTAVIPNLLGSDRHYFITYHTIYDPLCGNPSTAQSGKLYDFAVLYKDSDPAQYGYKQVDMVYKDSEDVIRVYRKP